MACYIVSYDLRNERDYPELYAALKAYGTWARMTASTWAVVTPESAAEIRNYLSQFMDPDDRLFVIQSGTQGAWHNVRCGKEWLQKYL